MKIAIIENNKVTNVVEGEPEVVANLFEHSIPETELTNKAWIGARYSGEKFEPVKIYDSWVWNESAFEYASPKPKPEGDYYWSEEDQDWLVIPLPIDPDTGLQILEAQAEEITEQ